MNLRQACELAIVLGLAACGGEELFAPELGRTDRLLSTEAAARFDKDDEDLATAVVVGDLDGDGIDDAIIGTEYLVDLGNGNEDQDANLYVLYGGSGLTGDIALASLPVLTGGAKYLPSVAAVGDLDGDGLADFVLGAPRGGTDSGAYIVYGSKTRFTGTTPLASAGVFLHDPSARPFIEDPVRVGDLDGDGLADFVIRHVDSVAEVLVYYGRRQRLIGSLDMVAAADAVITRSSGPEASAYALGTGDVDGDGHPDFLLAFNGNDETRLVRGSATRLAGTHTLGEVGSTELVGMPLTAQFGSSLGDLDGDGFDDFMLSTFDEDKLQQAKLVFYGRAGGFGATLHAGQQDATIYGTAEIPGSIAVHDLDGDGHADLIFGDEEARDDNGAVRIFPGTGHRLTGTIATDAPAISYVGAPSHATRCEYAPDGSHCIVTERVGAVVAIGDLTGDHHPDLLIGAPTSLFNATLGKHGSAMEHTYLLQP